VYGNADGRFYVHAVTSTVIANSTPIGEISFYALKLYKHTSDIIVVTRFSCLEARCVFRQAAITYYFKRLPKSYPLLDSPDSIMTQPTMGTVLSIYTAPRQPGPLRIIWVAVVDVGDGNDC
jgi:hypothetical protein